MNRVAFTLFLSTSVVACVGADPSTGSDEANLESQGDNGAPAPDARGVQWARGDASHHGGGGSPNLVYHGGPVNSAGTYVEAIYWGPSWSSSSFVGDKFSGIQSFYQGLNGSSYGATNTEYADSTGAHASTSVTWAGSHIDTATAPRNGGRTSPILNEACAQATKLVPNGYYPVYVDSKRGHSGYCAWHSTGTCPDGTQIQFAFFYNLDGDPGCDPQDTSGLHSQGVSALANVSGHEWSEMETDMHIDAWYDASGAENADKCAWSFGTPLLKFSNNSQWKVQGNWSNNAFAGNTGYANTSGQNGCLDGGNYR